MILMVIIGPLNEEWNGWSRNEFEGESGGKSEEGRMG